MELIWKILIFILIGLGLLTFGLILFLNLKKSFGACKSDASCPHGQVCRDGSCVSLPGFSCSTNEQCSSFAPLCHPTEHYCTNFPSLPRGAAGNPPSTSTPECVGNLIFNVDANICQYSSIGSTCTKNAECGIGLCDGTTCQFSSSCTQTKTLNPHQCSPGQECLGNLCEIPGIPAGGDGSPCTSNLDCKVGNTCILGPPGSTWKGICRSGQLTWLVLFTSPKQQCVSPLMGGDTPWCRYDIDSFMGCNTNLMCQAPYSSCGSKNLCIPADLELDPIITAGFNYQNIGINSTFPFGLPVSFYVAGFPTGQNGDVSGGRLLQPFTGFLSLPKQFADVFNGHDDISFSAVTSFTVISFAKSPIVDYHTILSDEQDSAVIVSIIITPGKLTLLEYRENFINSTIVVQGISPAMSLWTPARISAESISGVFFIQNPICSPRPASQSGDQTFSCFHHTLLVSQDLTYNLGLFFSTPRGGVGTIIETNMFSNIVVVTSWDAISTVFSQTINTVVFLYGLDKSPQVGKYQLFIFTLTLDINFNVLKRNSAPKPVQIQQELLLPNSHFRLSRTNQNIEPLLVASFFGITNEGLSVRSFAIPSDANEAILNFDTQFACNQTHVFKGVTGLSFVTSITGGTALGNAFVVRFSTPAVRVGFLIVQVNFTCRNDLPLGAFLYSAIFWRELVGDPEPPNYILYPIGGASIPFFIAAPAPLKFDGTPNL